MKKYYIIILNKKETINDIVVQNKNNYVRSLIHQCFRDYKINLCNTQNCIIDWKRNLDFLYKIV